MGIMDNEAQTRMVKIDHALARAGWSPGDRCCVEELFIPLQSAIVREDQQTQARGFADYGLRDRFDRPVAIVEAKRSSRSPLEGERQASEYAEQIAKIHGITPFIFLSNGDEHWFMETPAGPPRRVSGFFSPDDLERLAFQRRYREPLTGASVAERIINRAYQTNAVKEVAERIENGRRQFLLVMATGTGKTRVAVALVELLMRCKWIERVLFLADRRELVKQALDAFKEHLPDVPRARIESGEMDSTARIFASTYPAMMAAFPRLSPGAFDLIFADESHRSIYSRYRSIFEHFYALQTGLTATPTDFIDHNTFSLFDCPDGLPTFHYSYDEAIADGHLVPYRPVHAARTHFQIEGLEPGQLPPELAAQLREQGIAPEDLSFEGTDLERRVTNTGTNDSIVREFMEHSIKDAVGTLPAKSIIFAVSHRHALEIYQSFIRLYPDLQRRGLARVIDSHMERAEETLDDFKLKDFPRVAISVDMLDTGVDVPAIRNLVFAKPVFSRVKFWQMIGRGTRLWTDPHSGEKKRDFLIIDHWDNFAYHQVNPDGRTGHVTEPLPVRLFRLRLEKMQILAGRGLSTEAATVCTVLKEMLDSIAEGSVSVAPHLAELRQLRDDSSAWLPLDDNRVQHLGQVIAPLLRFSTLTGWPSLQFENLTEQLALAHLRTDTGEIERLREHILENLRLLPTELPEIRVHLAALTFALSNGFWDHLEYARIMQVQTTFAPLMRFRARRGTGEMIRLSLPDEIAQRHWIIFGPGGEGAFASAYRAQVEAYIRDLAERHSALRRLRTGEELASDDLDTVAALLNGPDLFITEERLRAAYDQPSASLTDFLRHILRPGSELPTRERRITEAFEEWIRAHPQLNATQLMFLRALRQAVLSRARIESREQLHQPPFSRIGDPELLFKKPELDELLNLIHTIAA